MTDGSSESEVKEIVPSTNGSRRRQFQEDVCFAFISCDIPLNNVNKEPMRILFKKFSGKSLPDQSTLRKYYVRNIYENTMKNLRGKANGQKLWVSIDESTDVEQRYVACFVFSILGVEEEKRKCYLSNVSVLAKG